MKTKINTDGDSLGKIYVEKEIGKLWYNHNDRETYNSLEKTISFFNKCKTKGFVNVRVEPMCQESEFSLDSYYIVVYGYRKETTKEFKQRISNIYNRYEGNAERTLNAYDYYTSTVFENQQKKLQKLMK
jgi:hypothetical protein